MVQTTAHARSDESAARVVARKREILAAASRVFREKGLQATGMRDIADELGMAVGNLYYYFEDKEALLGFCQEQALDGLLAIAHRVESLDLRADARLYLLIVGHIVHLNEVIRGSLAHLEVEALHGDWRRAIQRRRDAYEGIYRRIIAEGVASGVFRSMDATEVKVAGLAILGAVSWTVKWFRAEGGLEASDLGRSFARLLIGGLMSSGLALVPPPGDVAVRVLSPEPQIESRETSREEA